MVGAVNSEPKRHYSFLIEQMKIYHYYLSHQETIWKMLSSSADTTESVFCRENLLTGIFNLGLDV